MKHTDAEIEEAARRFETLADELDPETASVEDLADLRAIAEAAGAHGGMRHCSPSGWRWPGRTDAAGTR
jgi:hypothetical protein